jgi:hypothetical protein
VGKLANGIATFSSLLFVSSAQGFEIERADALYQDREYRVVLELVLQAPAEKVEAVLRDYENYPSLDASILEAKLLSRQDERTVMLFTRLRACSGLFCRTVKRVERVEEAPMQLVALVIPAQSDVHSGSTKTVLVSVNGVTRVQYESTVVPKFWVPGLVGRPLMLRTLREASLDLFRHVEARAKL